MTRFFYNKQYQLYHKAETDCLLLTTFIFRKAHFPCPREAPALLSFRLLNGNFGMFASSLCWRVKIYSGIQNFTMSLVLDNPRIKGHNVIQNSLVGERTWQTEVNLIKNILRNCFHHKIWELSISVLIWQDVIISWSTTGEYLGPVALPSPSQEFHHFKEGCFLLTLSL